MTFKVLVTGNLFSAKITARRLETPRILRYRSRAKADHLGDPTGVFRIEFRMPAAQQYAAISVLRQNHGGRADHFPFLKFIHKRFRRKVRQDNVGIQVAAASVRKDGTARVSNGLFFRPAGKKRLPFPGERDRHVAAAETAPTPGTKR